MAIKVLIERVVKAGHEELVWNMLRDLRGQAVRQKGYLYGESWRSLDNPRTFMVSTTWGSREYWAAWANDEFQRNVDLSISALLRKPSTIRVYEELSTLPASDIKSRTGARRRSRS